jgi:purine-binding chemotaxis protein CheW
MSDPNVGSAEPALQSYANQHNHDGRVETKREKYLIFALLDETYGMPLSSVKEVIGLTPITKVPNVPEYFKGLINLRGQIISVIDLRAKLGLPKTDYREKKTCIIILELDGFILGTIVDDVSAVAGFMSSQIQRSLDIQSKVSKEFVNGVAKTENKKLTILLNAERVLSVEELKLLKNVQMAA